MEKLKISKIVKSKPLDELSMETLREKKAASLYKPDLSKTIRKGSFWSGFLIGQMVKMGKIEKKNCKKREFGQKRHIKGSTTRGPFF